MKKSTPYSRGKRRQINEKKVNKKRVFAILTVLIIAMLFCFGYQETSKKNTNENDEVIDTVQIESDDEITDTYEETAKEDLPDEIGGYMVIGRLVIDKLGIDKEILYKTDEKSLKLSVTKFYGPNINEKGNFCITGHNYENMLKKVINGLEKNDTFYLINNENKTKQTYSVFDKYTCKPTDLKCLDSVFPGKKEVTLITCNPGGATRLIIKAKEV